MSSLPLHFLFFLLFLQSSFGQILTPAQQTCMVNCMATGTCNCGFVVNCATGWVTGPTARRCYNIVVPTTPGYQWAQAQANCQQSNGANLVSVHNQADNAFLFNMMTNAPNPDGKMHSFWIGMQLTRNAAGQVTGGGWSDGSALDYGNPVSGRGTYPWAVGEPVNAGNCVRMMNYGPYRGQWYDAGCAQPTTFIPTVGYFCMGCPEGWSMFQGHCYRIFTPRDGTLTEFQRVCALFNSNIVSIHSQAENDFVFSLMQRNAPTAWALLIGLRITRAGDGTIQGLQWTDGTPVDFGANTAGGIPPWADSGTGYPNQPDNAPRPAMCTMIWMDSTVPSGNKQPGRWDDISCDRTQLAGTICKF